MFVLDTYNVVHAGQAMGGAMTNLSVWKLCQWIMSSPKPMRVTLVMDGRAKPDEPGENEFPELDLIYSGTGIPADIVIAQIVERGQSNRKRHGKGTKLCVVSNDRAVAQHARINNATAITCESFLELLMASDRAAPTKNSLPAKKTGGPISAGETEEWLRAFGITPPPKPPKPKQPPQTDGELDIEKLMGP